MAQTLDDLCIAGQVSPEIVQGETYEWPENGATHELFVVKLPDCDDAPDVLDPPIAIHHLLDAIGCGNRMTGDLYRRANH